MTRVTGKLSSGTLLYMSPEQLNGASLSNVDSEGRYWASGQSPGGNGARYLFFNSIDRNLGGSSIRDYGLNIRPVYGLAK
jgi:hypothetical protein